MSVSLLKYFFSRLLGSTTRKSISVLKDYENVCDAVCISEELNLIEEEILVHINVLCVRSYHVRDTVYCSSAFDK